MEDCVFTEIQYLGQQLQYFELWTVFLQIGDNKYFDKLCEFHVTYKKLFSIIRFPRTS